MELVGTKVTISSYHEILESGFQAASLERILAKTSVSRGALYHHFGTKHDLGLAVITEVIRPQLEERWITLLAQHDNPIKGLCNLIAEEISHADESVIRYGCLLNNLIREMNPLDESFRQGLQKIFERWVEVVAKALKKGQSEGQVRSDMTPEDIALYLVASIEGCVGLGKNTQSVDAYQRCLRQLQVYIQYLAV